MQMPLPVWDQCPDVAALMCSPFFHWMKDVPKPQTSFGVLALFAMSLGGMVYGALLLWVSEGVYSSLRHRPALLIVGMAAHLGCVVASVVWWIIYLSY